MNDADLYYQTKNIVFEGLKQEKRWKNVPYIPALYADDVYTHVQSTKNSASQILLPFKKHLRLDRESDHQAANQLEYSAHEMIDWHDAPEAGGEYLIGDFEKILKDIGYNLHPLELQNFTFIYYHAEQAALKDDPQLFLTEMNKTKDYMAEHFLFDGKNLDPEIAIHGFTKLNEYLSDYSMSVMYSNGFHKAMANFRQIENDYSRKKDFPAAWAKALEKNDAYTHMGRVFKAKRDISSRIGPDFTHQKNDRLLRNMSRNSLFFEDMMVSAKTSGIPFYKDVAKDTFRFICETEQNYLKYGPAYISFANTGITEPEIDDADEHHDRYATEIKSAYDAQPEDDKKKTILTRRELLLHLEAAKRTITVPPPGVCVAEMSVRSEKYWNTYATYKRRGLFLDY
jgi:hypothetical protein